MLIRALRAKRAFVSTPVPQDPHAMTARLSGYGWLIYQDDGCRIWNSMPLAVVAYADHEAADNYTEDPDCSERY